ncbi:MAG: GNAT family N-acetyltransferase [Halanaeroarchaeum sp.]
MQNRTKPERAQVRLATPEDGTSIRRIASRSFHDSYGSVIDSEVIDETVQRWYGPDQLVDRLGSIDTIFLVATFGSEIAGFSESTHEPDAYVAAIDWLHVDPFHRGSGLGKRLLHETEETLLRRGADRVAGRVLAGNTLGNEFYQVQDYTLTGSRTIEIDGEAYTENRYLADPDGEEDDPLLKPVDVEDRTVYVSVDERERGTVGPFYMAYSTEGTEDRYGYYCGNCGSVRIAMDSMGRITCDECDNERKPSRWDSGYL